MNRMLMAGLALGFGLFGAATGADADGYRRPCASCGATGTTRIYRTIHPVEHVTRYHDRSVYHYVTRLHYVVNVTRVQPLIQVTDVTRLHHLTVVRDAYAYPPQGLEPYAQQSPASACACGE